MPAAGYPLHHIDAAGLNRRNPIKAARAALKALRGVRVGPAAGSARCARTSLMGGGGYIAGPVGLAAVALRVPIVLTEADSRMGIANRALAPFARRVCLGLPDRGANRREVTASPGGRSGRR